MSKNRPPSLADQFQSLADEMADAAKATTESIVVMRATRIAARATTLIIDAAKAGSLATPTTGVMLSFWKLARMDDTANVKPDQLVTLWRMSVLPWLRSSRPKMFSHQGASFDYPTMTPEAEKLLKQARWVRPKYSKAVRERLKKDGIPVNFGGHIHPDDLAKINAAMMASPYLGKFQNYDAAKQLAHAQEHAIYWRDALLAAVDVAREAIPIDEVPLNGIPSTQPRRKQATSPNDPRDKWIYKQVCKVDKPLDKIIGELRRKIELQPVGKKWGTIGTKQGIRRAAIEFAKRFKLSAPPSRQDK